MNFLEEAEDFLEGDFIVAMCKINGGSRTEQIHFQMLRIAKGCLGKFVHLSGHAYNNILQFQA